MYCRFYDEYNLLASSFTLIVDTREKEVPRYRKRLGMFEELGVKSERHRLNVGDYSAILKLPNGGVLDFTDKISVERKLSIEELIQCFGNERTRFEDELRRAKELDCKLYIATESGSYNDLVSGRYDRKMLTNLALSTYHTFQERFDARFEWVTPETFATFTYGTLRRFIFDHLMQNYPNGEILR